MLEREEMMCFLTVMKSVKTVLSGKCPIFRKEMSRQRIIEILSKDPQIELKMYLPRKINEQRF